MPLLEDVLTPSLTKWEIARDILVTNHQDGRELDEVTSRTKI